MSPLIKDNQPDNHRLARINVVNQYELVCTVQPATIGHELMDQISKMICLRQSDFFGLAFKVSDGDFKKPNGLVWLNLNEKILDERQFIFKTSKTTTNEELRLEFLVRYFPESFEHIIVDDRALNLLYLQIHQAILNDQIYCSAEVAVLLASYVMQITFGDYCQKKLGEICFDQLSLLPIRIINQYEITKDHWQDPIIEWWQEHRNSRWSEKQQAIMEYLRLAENLEMYGVEYFAIKNKSGTDLWLGVHALGLSIYEKENRLTSKIGFHWSEIRRLMIDRKHQVVIKLKEKQAKHLSFLTSSGVTKEKVLDLCEGYHRLYLQFRQPPSLEEKQIREIIEKEKQTDHNERRRMIRNIEHAQLEQRFKYETQLKLLTEEIDSLRKIVQQKDQQIGVLLLQQKNQHPLSTSGRSLSSPSSISSSSMTVIEHPSLNDSKKTVHFDCLMMMKDENGNVLSASKILDGQTSIINEDDIDKNYDTIDETIEIDPLNRTKTQLENLVTKLLSASNGGYCGSDQKLTKTVVDWTQQNEVKIQLKQDKFETLKKTLKGNTNRRIEFFQNL